MAKKKIDSCPCGSGSAYDDCCGRYISGSQPAPSAEALMRSRYTAYVLRDESYLLATWHPETRPDSLALEQNPAPQWASLDVKRHQQADDTHATVEFIARYKLNGRAFKLHELSHFLKQDGRWLYHDGLTPSAE